VPPVHPTLLGQPIPQIPQQQPRAPLPSAPPYAPVPQGSPRPQVAPSPQQGYAAPPQPMAPPLRVAPLPQTAPPPQLASQRPMPTSQPQSQPTSPPQQPAPTNAYALPPPPQRGLGGTVDMDDDQPTRMGASLSMVEVEPSIAAAPPARATSAPAAGASARPRPLVVDDPSTIKPGRELATGMVVAGRYRVEKILGHGGMGAVYAVRHVNTGEELALKVLHPALASNAQAVERFRTEARAPVRIASDHVVRVVDADVSPELGVPFLVMELLRGRDLGTELKRRGALPAGEVVLYMRQVARALDRAHGLGIVHRDLKPANLYLTMREDGTPLVKILDYGIAKLADATSGEATQDGTVFGTPWYMSPEQARGHASKVGPAADIWALGLIAFRLLTGQNYWTAEGMAALIGQICYEPMPPPTRMAPHLGTRFDAWFARACDRDATKRYATASEAVNELGAALGISGFGPMQGEPEASVPPMPVPPNQSQAGWHPHAMSMTPMHGMTPPQPGAHPMGSSQPSAPSFSGSFAPSSTALAKKPGPSAAAAVVAGLAIAFVIAGGGGAVWYVVARRAAVAPANAEPSAAAAAAIAPTATAASASASGSASAEAASSAEPAAEASAEPAAEASAEPAATAEPAASARPAAPPSASPRAPMPAPAATSAKPTAPAPTGNKPPARSPSKDQPPAPKVGNIRF
jgi:serine/threonine-protein kinase